MEEITEISLGNSGAEGTELNGKTEGWNGVSKPSCWDSGQQFVRNCEVDDVELVINMPPAIWADILSLTEEVDTEWLGYFMGDESIEGDTKAFNITSLVIPEQEVSHGSVSDIKEITGCIGVVHSHANMAAFFSSTDDEFINQNNPFSIVVNKRGDFKAVGKVELPCGAVLIKEASVSIFRGNQSFIDEAKSKLKEIKSNYTYKGIKELKPGLGDYSKHNPKQSKFRPDDTETPDDSLENFEELYDHYEEEFHYWLIAQESLKDLLDRVFPKSLIEDEFKEFMEDQGTELESDVESIASESVSLASKRYGKEKRWD